ncbi:hypothetical protein RRG08_033723 [Elysia crispata]|uniref:Uncharacterized protein n=1 Tax=Elysia crispata TaxID=231223 RepID=A0AAE1DUE4_9GAST|nr:hypothetical protein RRG08_033723 [Elysia crispata]
MTRRIIPERGQRRRTPSLSGCPVVNGVRYLQQPLTSPRPEKAMMAVDISSPDCSVVEEDGKGGVRIVEKGF